MLCLVLTACAQAPPSSSAGLVPSPSSLPAPLQVSPTTLPERPPYAGLRGTIVIDGSSTVFPISEQAALRFKELAPDVQIQLGVSGTGGGFEKFCAGETDISDASRPINAEEIAACAANGIEFIELPVAFDGLSVVVHPSNDWAQCLTVDELRRMWEPAAEGSLLRWNQLRSDWPDRPLELYGAGGDSGTYDYFTSAILGEEGVSRMDYIASEDDYLIAQDVSDNPNGLAFFGYAYYVEYGDQLRVVAVDGGAGCITPAPGSIADGSYQPLARPMFIYVSTAAIARQEVRAFVDEYLRNATDLVVAARYIPLPERVYNLALRRVERTTTGTVFTSGTQVGLRSKSC
ncbi:PstS family phosphate ABC transporter substrate-binding protein [Candidatus Gracilibacteria bacterium]|nr:PstS family phosphate ABC transporter substrate-binding protein [Candidatus Gracilibacteria bacterium]